MGGLATRSRAALGINPSALRPGCAVRAELGTGRGGYYDYYKPKDHADLSTFIKRNMRGRFWMVSYDNTAAIKNLYSGFRSVVYNVGYTAREHRVGKEVMFFSPKLEVPALVGPVQQIGPIRTAA